VYISTLSFAGGPLPFVHPPPDEKQISILPEVSKAQCFSFFTSALVFEHPTSLPFPSTSAAYLTLTAPLWTSLAVHQNAVVFCLIAKKKEKKPNFN